MIVDFIDQMKSEFGVDPICRVLSEHLWPFAPSVYYAFHARGISARDMDDAYLVEQIIGLWQQNYSCYGVMKMWHLLARRGVGVGRDRVARLMRLAGLQGVVRGKRRTRMTVAGTGLARHPDRCHRAWAVPSRPDLWWIADFTYVWTMKGFCYVAFVTDVFSPKILGWSVSVTKDTQFVIRALRQAVSVRGRADPQFRPTGIVHHSDAGSQCTAVMFLTDLDDLGMLGSIGTVGDALDNAMMESTIGLYKTELIDRDQAHWENSIHVEYATARWVNWYNTTRLHSAIAYRSPDEHEAEYHSHTRAGKPPDSI
jgi:transposase InsO family protein